MLAYGALVIYAAMIMVTFGVITTDDTKWFTIPVFFLGACVWPLLLVMSVGIVMAYDTFMVGRKLQGVLSKIVDFCIFES
jgi:hypothetical protein